MEYLEKSGQDSGVCGPECLERVLKKYSRPTLFKFPTCITRSNLEAIIREALIHIQSLCNCANYEEREAEAYKALAAAAEKLLEIDFPRGHSISSNLS